MKTEKMKNYLIVLMAVGMLLQVGENLYKVPIAIFESSIVTMARNIEKKDTLRAVENTNGVVKRKENIDNLIDELFVDEVATDEVEPDDYEKLDEVDVFYRDEDITIVGLKAVRLNDEDTLFMLTDNVSRRVVYMDDSGFIQDGDNYEVAFITDTDEIIEVEQSNFKFSYEFLDEFIDIDLGAIKQDI